MIGFEREAFAAGFRRVAGLDEAGRGPLAGPVVAACVILPLDGGVPRDLDGLTDSKQLTAAQRERFLGVLRRLPGVAIGVGRASVAEIDRLNILRATHRAMARAAAALKPPADFLLVDGLPVPGLPCPSRAIVHGDALSLSIAAASVVAKVTRDRLMTAIDLRHPGYGFARHKGYGTAVHLAALRSLGPCPAHRRTFRPVAESGPQPARPGQPPLPGME